jgi:hypothetical protein
MNRFTPPQQKGGVKKGKSIMKQQLNKQGGDPYGIRTRVAAVKGQCPRPLDEGVI